MGSALKDLVRQYGATHVIVRLPQRVESDSLWARCRGQIATIQDMPNITLGGYGWLYKNVPAEQQANDWVDFLAEQQVTVPVLWIDVEPYQTNDNLPSVEQIKTAAQTLESRAARPGIYTGPWVWNLLDNPTDPYLMGLPLWTAEYNQIATLEGVTLYGGWTVCVGHQYSTSGGIDQDVFDQRVTLV